MNAPVPVGASWRPELALAIERRESIRVIEVIAEDLDPDDLPAPLLALRRRGVQVIPHAVSLSLGSTGSRGRSGLPA